MASEITGRASATTADLRPGRGGVISVRGLRKSYVSDAQPQAGWSNLSFDGRWVNHGVILLAVYLVALVTTYSRAVRASCMYPAAALRSPVSTRRGCSA